MTLNWKDSLKYETMIYKTIASGELEFGSSKSYEKVVKMYQHRIENYYKTDLFLNFEELFNEENYTLHIPRTITESSNKNWKNTISLLEYLAQFSLAGQVTLFMVENGTIINEKIIEPVCDKVAVQAFLKGRNLGKEKGKEKEALTAFDKAIAKYERHAYAYEKRGYIKLKLKDYEGAMTDFSKSININPNIPEPFVGKGKLQMVLKDYKMATFDFASASRNSIPLQPIYWQAKRMKAECHLKLKEHGEAIKELKAFCHRQFKQDNPNYKHIEWAWFNYGKALLEIGESESALEIFNKSMERNSNKEKEIKPDFFLYRGIARQKVGKTGFVKDWTEAAEKGSKRASKLLESVS